MKKQKIVQFNSLAELGDKLENNLDKYKTVVFDTDSIFIGDLSISRHYNIDPENMCEQFRIHNNTNGLEYIVLPNKAWFTLNQTGRNFIEYNYSKHLGGELVYYQIANAFQEIINKNYKQIKFRRLRHNLWFALWISFVAAVTANVTRDILDKKQDKAPKAPNAKEIMVDTTKMQTNTLDTIMYNAAAWNK